MITQRELKEFARDCLKWAEIAPDASNKQVIISAAQSWLRVAEQLEQRLSRGGKLTGDLRVKLN